MRKLVVKCTAGAEDAERCNQAFTVAATAGTLTKVKLSYTNKDRQGRAQHGVVSGTMSKDRLKWTANARLDPATAYKLTSAGKNTVNQAQSVATSFPADEYVPR